MQAGTHAEGILALGPVGAGGRGRPLPTQGRPRRTRFGRQGCPRQGSQAAGRREGSLPRVLHAPSHPPLLVRKAGGQQPQDVLGKAHGAPPGLAWSQGLHLGPRPQGHLRLREPGEWTGTPGRRRGSPEPHVGTWGTPASAAVLATQKTGQERDRERRCLGPGRGLLPRGASGLQSCGHPGRRSCGSRRSREAAQSRWTLGVTSIPHADMLLPLRSPGQPRGLRGDRGTVGGPGGSGGARNSRGARPGGVAAVWVGFTRRSWQAEGGAGTCAHGHRGSPSRWHKRPRAAQAEQHSSPSPPPAPAEPPRTESPFMGPVGGPGPAAGGGWEGGRGPGSLTTGPAVLGPAPAPA